MRDKQSAIPLENNGRYYIGKGSKHINIRHNFIIDRIEEKRVTVKYRLTAEMIADLSERSLRGALFFKVRDGIRGGFTGRKNGSIF